jgi:hypothetical protein
MTGAIKKFISVVTSGTSGNYDKSAFPVKISGNGSVGADSVTVVSSTAAQRQIGAARELQQTIKDSKK